MKRLLPIFAAIQLILAAATPATAIVPEIAIPGLDGAQALNMPDTPAEFTESLTQDWVDREELASVLEEAGSNWTELARALYAVQPYDPEHDPESAFYNMHWLIVNAPHLDRLELTAEMLWNNWIEARDTADNHGYSSDNDFFRRYILNYRLDDEPVTAWRAELLGRYSGNAESDMRAYIEGISEQAASNFNVLERGYFGNLGDPVAIDNARSGTQSELALLTAAALRSQGFATRFVREGRTGESWVEVFSGTPEDEDAWLDMKRWQPVYPGAPEHTFDKDYAKELCSGRITVVTAGDAFGRVQITASYADMGAAIVMWEKFGEDVTDFEHFSINAWHGGKWTPVDDLLWYPETSVAGNLDELTEGSEHSDYADRFDTFGLGVGDYRLVCGVRYPGGYVHVQQQDFSIRRAQIELLRTDITPPADLPLSAMAERSVDLDALPQEYAWLVNGVQLIVVLDDSEPSVRMRDLLMEWSDEAQIHRMELAMPADWEQREEFYKALNLRKNDTMPVVILLSQGETLVYSRGYNLGIVEWCKQALEAADRE